VKPPFRADQVGSLLRPAYLAQARKDRKLQDKAILEAIRRQEEIGLESITDGEFRRDWRHLDFLRQI